MRFNFKPGRHNTHKHTLSLVTYAGRACGLNLFMGNESMRYEQGNDVPTTQSKLEYMFKHTSYIITSRARVTVINSSDQQHVAGVHDLGKPVQIVLVLIVDQQKFEPLDENIEDVAPPAENT